MLSVSTKVPWGVGGRGCPRSQNEECRLLIKPVQQSKGLQACTHNSVLLTVATGRDAQYPKRHKQRWRGVEKGRRSRVNVQGQSYHPAEVPTSMRMNFPGISNNKM